MPQIRETTQQTWWKLVTSRIYRGGTSPKDNIVDHKISYNYGHEQFLLIDHFFGHIFSQNGAFNSLLFSSVLNQARI